MLSAATAQLLQIQDFGDDFCVMPRPQRHLETAYLSQRHRALYMAFCRAARLQSPVTRQPMAAAIQSMCGLEIKRQVTS